MPKKIMIEGEYVRKYKFEAEISDEEYRLLKEVSEKDVKENDHPDEFSFIAGVIYKSMACSKENSFDNFKMTVVK